ncbi:MAG: fibronectin type III domain-containing protein [Bacteroidales bacterium]|nr:fibronectin type III domain-containing protein [Bacteroidales bacterium]
MKATWVSGVGVSRLISPLIRFDNVEMAQLSFKHYYDNYHDSTGVTIKLQCSPDFVTWTDLPFSHSGSNIAATTQTIQFAPMADSLYLAWVIDGNHYQFDYWYIDDVSITEVCLPKALPYTENFTTSPHCWTQTHSGGVSSDRWFHSMTVDAGGAIGEMMGEGQQYYGESRLILPLIRFDNVEAARLSFKHHYDGWNLDIVIKLQCSPDLVNWTDLPFSYSGGDIAATTQTVQFVPMAYSLYIAWVIDGNHDDFNYWFIDDVSITEVCLPKVLPYSEDFTTSPHCWTQTHSGGVTSDRWKYAVNGTEGAMIALQTHETGLSRLISPLIRFDNVERAELSFEHQFHFLTPGVLIKLQCSSDLQTWTDLPFSHSGGNIPLTTQTVQFVPSADSLYIAWVIEGNHYRFNNWYIDDVFITEIPPCVQPTNLAISNVSSTEATATWTAGGSETSWQIEYKTASAGTWTTQTVNNPTYTMTGLQPTTAYQVRVKSLCGSGSESAYTTVVSFTTSATPCVVPTNLAISNISSTGATATWLAGGTESFWQIEYKTELDTVWTTQFVITSTYTMTGLQPSTGYEVRVKSLCDNGEESAYTTAVSFTTAAPPCVVPTNLAISNVSSTGATATWIAGGSETSWQIEYKTATATTWIIQTVTTPTYTMIGLQPSTDYQVKVKSLCGGGVESDYTTAVSFTTAAPLCVVPTNLAISNVSSTGATATWTAGGSETSWQIEYKTTTATTWIIQTVTTPTYTMIGLQPSTDYQVKVKSLCGIGVESDYTTVVSFTTAATPCVVPTNLAISNVSSTGATANWTAGGSETSWQIEYKAASSGTWTTQTVNNPTYTMTDLQPTTSYEIRVKSLCGAGVESAYTTVVSFTTAAPPCVVPTNLAISSISSTGATATWTAGGSETSWEFEYRLIGAADWTTQTVTTPTYSMTGLQPSTAYEVRVKSLCDDGEESAYTEPVSFTTDAIPTYTITATAGSNGTITPSGTVTVNEGASQTFIFTPNEGYQINTVIVDNQPIEPIPTSYTFENVQADHTIHVDFTVGIDENELSRYVTLYPNPTQSYIDLKLDKDYLIATECRIYDMYGKLMRILPIEEEITTIDVSDFAVGVYFVRLTTEQGQISKRFVKQ